MSKTSTNVASKDRFNFEAKLVGRYICIFPANLRNEWAIHEYHEETKIQHYLFPDREIPLKVVMRGLAIHTDLGNLKDLE